MTGASRARAVRATRSGEAVGDPVVLRGGLGDLPVLAELAAERAAGGGERERRRAGEEMVEGLLLDRIDVDGDRAAVDEAPELAAHVHPGAAAAPLAGLDDAPLGAQEALDEPRLVADPLPLQLFPGGMALAAVGAGEGDGGPPARPGGEADQVAVHVEGEEGSGALAEQEALPEGGGEAQSRPAEDRGHPGQRLDESAS